MSDKADAASVIRRNGVTQRGQPAASGACTLVFGHGFGTDQTMWRHVVPAFERHHVVLFDYVGSGGSDTRAYDPARYATLEGYVQDLLDVVEALDLTQVIFIGHSMSGMVGLLAAIRAPRRFERLVMVGSSPCYIDHPPDYVGGFSRSDIDTLLAMIEHNFAAWSDAMAPVIMRNDDQPGLAREFGNSLVAMDPDIAHRCAHAIFTADLRAALPYCPVPSLVMQARDDIVVPHEVGDYLHRHLPRNTLRRLQATGHCPHLSQPQETIAVIADYLDTRLST